MKKVFAFLSVVVVLVCFTISTFAVTQPNEFTWYPYYPFVNNEMNFTPIEGQTEYESGDNLYFIWGSWRFQNNINSLLIPVESDVPSDANTYFYLFTQSRYDLGVMDALALVYSVGGVYVANGGIILTLQRLPNNPSYAEVTKVQAYDYSRDALMTLYDSTNGWVNDSYRNISFGGYETRQTVTPGFHRFLIETDILQPIVVDYGPDIDSVDFTTWLVTAVGGFMNFSLFGGFTIGHMFGAIVALSFTMIFLRFFAGG